ncbi:het domain-containing protein [Colletotrichum karsti]|uniref:Het domain-containing protein n=1 Tax=Colletotrichum karsti TaxID=1095194 RepID=A0A9P6LEC7_9PEZI|nr:het domain-containing protein [Colletotrichum karsti]KAF9870253.1 het domain-containing protein [Colletotrichum karsti]
MRVLDTTTLELVEFHDLPLKPYVTLSHTWGRGEVTFQEMTALHAEEGSSKRRKAAIRQKRGFRKISTTCAKARDDGFAYAWVDTCCIDKTSSAELSESINSMFRWYQESAICYAYLVDVSTADDVVDVWDEARFDRDGLFAASRWFTRGWTLQELLAPEVVEFYAADWTEIGTKSSLASRIAGITKIDVDVLEGKKSIRRRCAAERLSWAAARQTTRMEDMAYSLLGIMDVNMPLLYGEGKRAFMRLQEAMLKEREDYSLLLPNLATYITAMLRETVSPPGDVTVSLGEDSSRAPPLAEDPSDFRVEDPSIWSYAMVDYWTATESAMGTESHHAPYLSPRGLQICLRPGGEPGGANDSKRLMSRRFDTYCRTMNHCIFIGLSGSPIGSNFVRTRAFDLVPFDGRDRSWKRNIINRFQSICILQLGTRALTHRSQRNLRLGEGVSSSGWIVDASSLSTLEMVWFDELDDNLAIGPEIWQRVVAMGWCYGAPGEAGPFLFAVGDHWSAILTQSECRSRGIVTGNSERCTAAMTDAIRTKVSEKGPDRQFIRLREVVIQVTFRNTGADEAIGTLTLTAHWKTK